MKHITKAESNASELAAFHGAIARELEDLKERGLLRRLEEDRSGLDFSSNDYLSLNESDFFTRRATKLLEGRDGLGSGGSRLLRGHHPQFTRAEEAFAAFTGQRSALLFQSGYAANIGALQALLGPRDRVFCDRLAHASLLDGIRQSGARRTYFRHNDLDDLERLLRTHGGNRRGRDWIVSETIFSMDGDGPDLKALTELAERRGALLYLDEAHAIGMAGPHGAGRIAQEKISERVAVAVYPCGKAPGLMGAFVCGAPEIRAYLINRARSFIFSTAQPPLFAELLMSVLEYFRTEDAETRRKRVLKLAGLFRREIGGACELVPGDSQIVPFILGSPERALEVAAACRNEGFDVRAIRPPSVPPEGSRLRLTFPAARTPDEVKRLAQTLKNV